MNNNIQQLSIIKKMINTYILVDTFLKYYLLTALILFISHEYILLSVVHAILKFVSEKVLFTDKQPIKKKADIVTYILAISIGMIVSYIINSKIISYYE